MATYWREEAVLLLVDSLMRVVSVTLIASLNLSSLVLSTSSAAESVPRPTKAASGMFQAAAVALASSAGPTTALHEQVPVLVIPDNAESNKSFRQALASFDRVPTETGEVGSAEPASTIQESLAKVSRDVQFGQIPISSDQEKEISVAYSKLFSDKARTIQTYSYREYLDYQKQDLSLNKSLSSDSNPAQKVNIQNKIDILERNWSLFGHKDEIDNALRVIDAARPGDKQELLASWKQAISSGADVDPVQIIQSISSSNWITVTLADTSQYSITLEVDGKSTSLPKIKSMQFEVSVVSITRTAFEHPFLDDKTWRTKSGFVLSDGTGTRSKSELVPAFVSHLVLCKNVEFVLESNLSKEVASVLLNPAGVTLAGVPITGPQSGLFYQPRYLAISRPFILAYGVEETRKAPDPEPGLSWIN